MSAALRTSCRLNVAARNGNFDSVVHLVQQHSADIDANDGEALSLASGSGHTDVVGFLLNEGAKPSRRALELALEGGHTSTVRVLERRIEKRRIEELRAKKLRAKKLRAKKLRAKKLRADKRRAEKNKKPKMVYKQESLGDIDMRPTAQTGAFLGPKFLDKSSLGGCVFV